MFNLYYSVFSVSYDSLKLYHSITEIDKWDNERKSINSKINHIIFEFLSKRSRRKKINDQFFLDYVNFFLCQHISNRNNLYKKGASKLTFIFLSFIDKYLISLRLIVSSFKNFILNYKFENVRKISDCTLCIGFPEHAFSYSKEHISNPNSFIEYSLNNHIFNEDENLLSFEEYKRPSLKYDKQYSDSSLPKSFNRQKIKTKLSFFKMLIVWPSLLYFYILSIKKNKSISISVFSYFFRNKQLSYKYLDLVNRLKKMNISINNIIFLHTHYIYGSVFGALNEKKIKTFHYSQNYQSSTSGLISDWLSQNFNSSRLNVESIEQELYSRLFSEHYLNPINFSYHGKFFSKIRSLINEKYKINLLGLESKDEKKNRYIEENNYSNMGYEKIQIIDLKLRKSILFLDNSIESREENISRNMFGDFTALEEFMFEFYKEIISVAKSLNFKLYYKGKYWQDEARKSLLDKASEALDYKVYKIDPYSKLILPNKKFDCIINYPFTSTYFTFGNLGDKNLFFIPTNYISSFNKDIQDICLGRNNLEKILNNNYEKNRR